MTPARIWRVQSQITSMKTWAACTKSQMILCLNPSMLSWNRLPAFNLVRPFLPPSQRFKHPVVFMILAVGFSWVEPLLVDCNLPTRQFLYPNQALNQTASCYISKPSAKHQIASFLSPKASTKHQLPVFISQSKHQALTASF